jgi:hypothetical protein
MDELQQVGEFHLVHDGPIGQAELKDVRHVAAVSREARAFGRVKSMCNSNHTFSARCSSACQPLSLIGGQMGDVASIVYSALAARAVTIRGHTFVRS